jgi:hypothetical protein
MSTHWFDSIHKQINDSRIVTRSLRRKARAFYSVGNGSMYEYLAGMADNMVFGSGEGVIDTSLE